MIAEEFRQQAESIEVIIGSCADIEGKEVLKAGLDLLKKKGTKEFDADKARGLLVEACVSEDTRTSVWGHLLYSYLEGYNTFLLDNALEKMRGWSMDPYAYAMAYYFKAMNAIGEYRWGFRKQKHLSFLKYMLITSIINLPEPLFNYRAYCQIVAATKTNIFPNKAFYIYRPEYPTSSIAEEATMMFKETVLNKGFYDHTQFHKAIENIDDYIIGLYIASYLGIPINPDNSQEEFTIQEQQRDHLNNMLKSVIVDGSLRKKDVNYNVFFVGSRDFVEESITAYEKRMNMKLIMDVFVPGVNDLEDLDENLSAIKKYKQRSEYHVVLSFRDDPGTWVRGIGDTYEAAKMDAEDNFPFEAAGNLQEIVAVRAVYALPQSRINMLGWAKDEERIQVNEQ